MTGLGEFSYRTADAGQSGNGTGGGRVAAGAPGRLDSRKGGWLLGLACGLLLLLAAAQGYVSFRAQYAFVDHAKHARVPSILEALGLDTGAVIFAMLALALACRGRRATVERTLNVACALGSLVMNLLAADLGSPRSVAVWVLPSALYALASDRLIAVVRRWASDDGADAEASREGSAWRAFGGLVLWALRLLFDVRGTASGFRRWVLVVAPVAPGTRAAVAPGTEVGTLPGVATPPALPAGGGVNEGTDPAADPEEADGGAQPEPQQPNPLSGRDAPPEDELAPDGRGDGLGLASEGELTPGETKRASLIRLYERCGAEGDPRYGDRSRAAALAGEIAARIGYHPGTARRELAKYLAAQAPASPASPPEPESGPGFPTKAFAPDTGPDGAPGTVPRALVDADLDTDPESEPRVVPHTESDDEAVA